MPARTATICVTGAILLFAAACGSKTPTVSGQVTYKGAALPSGTVLFYAANGNTAHGVITDGRYAVADAPLGPVRITVRPHAAMPLGIPTSGKAPAARKDTAVPAEKRDGRFTPVPARYLDAATTPLTYSVRPGAQTHDLNLQP